MYYYTVGMWTRAEDPRNRTYADMFRFAYPPSGRQGQYGQLWLQIVTWCCDL